jgi:hypothetical protein
MLAIVVAFGLFYYVTNAKRSAMKFKKDHPIISVLIMLSGLYFIVYMLGSVMVFLFGILLPIMGMYVCIYVCMYVCMYVCAYAQQLWPVHVNRFFFPHLKCNF